MTARLSKTRRLASMNRIFAEAAARDRRAASPTIQKKQPKPAAAPEAPAGHEPLRLADLGRVWALRKMHPAKAIKRKWTEMLVSGPMAKCTIV